MGAVYEATQVSLGRRVALRLIPAERFESPDALSRFDERQRLAASLHHPNLVPCYAVGEWEGGRFVASRFVRGATLADLQEEAIAPPPEALEPLVQALRVGHEAGLVHGAVAAHNVLVEQSGRSYLADLGLRDAGTQAGDSEALAHLLAEAHATSSRPRGRGRALALALGVAAVCVVGVFVGLVIRGGDDTATPPTVPPVATDLKAVGSSLAGTVEPLGCSEVASSNTPACTLAQVRLDGAAVTVPRSGVIRSWVIRGASGAIQLQVLREGEGGTFVAGFDQPVAVDSGEIHAIAAEIPVRVGDRIGVRLEPGAAIGVRTDVSDALIARWDGGLTARQPNDSTGEVGDAELMLRADVEVGARVPPPTQITGADAGRLPEGNLVSTPSMEVPIPGRVQVAAVEVGGSIVLDVFRAGRRTVRMPVDDADPAGQFLDLTPHCGPNVASGFCFRWQNPGQTLPLEHEYFLRGDGRIETIG